MFDFFKRKLKVGDRVKVEFRGEKMGGTITAISVEPEQKWYGITLDDGYHVTRPEEAVERVKDA